MAYIQSYNTALQEVRNPNLAVQVATGVVITIAMMEQNQSQPQPILNPLEMIFSQIAERAKKEGKSEDKE